MFIHSGHPNSRNDCKYLCHLIAYIVKGIERPFKLYSDIISHLVIQQQIFEGSLPYRSLLLKNRTCKYRCYAR